MQRPFYTFFAALLCALTIFGTRPAAASDQPNIVLIMCDDMGFSDIASYGGEVATPNLDKLANNGVRFRTFYNNAKCEHTRASLITGQWWHHVGASASSSTKVRPLAIACVKLATAP